MNDTLPDGSALNMVQTAVAVIGNDDTGFQRAGLINLANAGGLAISGTTNALVQTWLGDDILMIGSDNYATTSTLTSSLFKLGTTSGFGAGRFYVDASGNVSASGTFRSFGSVTTTGHLYPATNDTYDLGAYGAAWRNIYASGTLYLTDDFFITTSTASTTLLSTVGTITKFHSDATTGANDGIGASLLWDLEDENGVATNTARIDVVADNTATTSFQTSIEFYQKLDNAYTLSKVLDIDSGNTLPGSNNAYDLGTFGVAWNDIFASGTSYLGSVTSTQITPWANNTYDLGFFGSAWKDAFVSGTTYMGATSSLYSTDGGAFGPDLVMYHNSPSPSGDYIGSLTFRANTAGLAMTDYARLSSERISGFGGLDFFVLNGSGSLREAMQVTVSSGGTGATQLYLGEIAGFTFQDSEINSTGNLILQRDTGFGTFVSSTFLVGNAAGNDNFFVSTDAARVGSTANSSTLAVFGTVTTTGRIEPQHNNAYDLGRYGQAWKDIYVSGTTYLGATSSLYSTDGGAFGAELFLFHNSPSVADSDTPGLVTVRGLNSANAVKDYGRIAFPIISTSTGEEISGIVFQTQDGSGSLANTMLVLPTSDRIAQMNIGSSYTTMASVGSASGNSLRLVGSAGMTLITQSNNNITVQPNGTGRFQVSSTLVLSDALGSTDDFRVDTSGNVYASGTVFNLGSTAGSIGLSIVTGAASTTFTSDVANGANRTAFEFVGNIASTTLGTPLDRMLFSVFNKNDSKYKFHISGGGNVYAAAGFNANSTEFGLGDVAEYVNLVPGETAEAGDVVVVDVGGLNQYRKSNEAYAQNVAGVISDTGAFLIGASGEGRAPLALAGLVNVKVTDENGPIAVGDYLVTASKPGYAMKYDSTSGKSAGLVGMALEPLVSGDGEIKVMVNKGLVMGVSAMGSPTLDVTQDANGNLVQTGDLDMAGQSILNVKSISSANGTWVIDENGDLVVNTLEVREHLIAGPDIVGQAKILTGSDRVRVTFEKPYDLPPIITITPVGIVTSTSGVENVTVTGFDIVMLPPSVTTTLFNWHAIASRGGKIFGSDGTVENISSTIADQPAVESGGAGSIPDAGTSGK